MKRSLFVRIVALMLVLCMLFSFAACGKKKKNNKGNDPVIEEQNPENGGGSGSEGGEITVQCQHTSTELKNVKAATCTAKGYTGDKVCSACGELIQAGTETDKTAHTYDDGMVTKVATCIEQGTLTYTCTGCGTTKSDSINTVGHDEKYHEMGDGTHTVTCNTCTALNTNAAHTPVDAGRYVDATCSENAHTVYTCSVCNLSYKVYDADNTELMAHNYGEMRVIKNATCQSAGKQAQECTECGYVNTSDVSAEAHEYVLDINASTIADCDEAGTDVYNCKHCGEFGYNVTTPATGMHDYAELENTGDGWVRKKCNDCGKIVSNFDASTLKEDEAISTENISTDIPFEVTNGTTSIEFPTEVLGQITGGTSVKIDAGIADDEKKNAAIEKADDEVKAALENADVYDFSVIVDGSNVSQFDKPLTVTIPYTLKENEEKTGIIIWYVSDDGEIEKITEGVVYNEDADGNGSVTFPTTHFSMYAVAYEETQAMKCQRGLHLYEKVRTVEPNCYTHGYTVYKCECCFGITFDDFVSKTGHNYGDTIAPTPTCESGDYMHRICADCGNRLNLTHEYVRALGHDLDRVADCTNASVCKRCDKVVTYPLGHSFTDWRVVVEAGDFNPGLKVRYCLRCGLSEQKEIASSGTISGLDFETYEDVINTLYDVIIGMDNGTIEVDYAVDGQGDANLKITVNKNGNDLLVRVDYDVTAVQYKLDPATKLEIEVEENYKGSAYYRNGVMIGDVPEKGAGMIDLDSAFFIPLNVVLTYMEAYFEILDPIAEYYFGSAGEALEYYLDIAADEINEVLAAAGIEYTAEDILEVLGSVESLYAYVALKLGYDTSIEMDEDFELPTKQDLLVIFDAFMQKTEEGANTKYSVNADKFISAVKTVVGWVNDRVDTSVATVLFELLGDELAKLDASIVDIDTLAEYLNVNFPGTLTVKDAIDKLATALEKSGAITLDEIYDLVNSVMTEMYSEQLEGQEFDIEAMISGYYNLTLNEFIAMLFEQMNSQQNNGGSDNISGGVVMPDVNVPVGGVGGNDAPLGSDNEKTDGDNTMPKGEEDPMVVAEEEKGEVGDDFVFEEEEFVAPTAEELYQMLAEELKFMLFGDLPMPTVISVAMPVRDYFGGIKEYLDVLEIKADFSFVVDENGKLVSLVLDEFVNAVFPGEEEGTTDKQSIQNLTINIVRDANVKVELPEKFAPLNFSVTYEYDAEGNLVISGIPVDFEIDASLRGAYDAALKDILVQYTGEIDLYNSIDYSDLTVYATPKNFWNAEREVASLLMIDGKYYTYSVESEFAFTPNSLMRQLDLFSFVDNPYSVIPTEGTAPDAYYEGTPIYFTAIGVLANINGEWCVCSDSFEYKNGSVQFYGLNRMYGFDEKFKDKTVTINSIDDVFYSAYGFITCEVILSVGDEAMEFNARTDYSGVSLVWYHNSAFVGSMKTAYTLTGEATLGNYKYDKLSKGEKETVTIKEGNSEVQKNVEFVHLVNYVPGNYYLKVADGVYVSLGRAGYDSSYAENLATKTLPDGNVMYVKGEKDAYVVGYEYGTVYYGYVKLGKEAYVRVYCVEQDGNIVNTTYEGQSTSYMTSYDNAFDVDSYMTVLSDGTVVIDKELIEIFRDTCVKDDWYAGIDLYATKTVNGEEYTVIVSKAIKYNPGEISTNNKHESVSINIFEYLFSTYDGPGAEMHIYLNENGNVVIESGSIHDIEGYLNNSILANGNHLSYNDKLSSETGYDIYSYSYQTIGEKRWNNGYTDQFLYMNGKYYYGWTTYQNYTKVETMSIEDIVSSMWKISSITPNFTVAAIEDNPTELHGKTVYRIGVRIGYKTMIHLYGVVYNGQLYILTGTHHDGMSLLTFEGYIPVKEFFNSLTIEPVNNEENSTWYINGVATTVSRVIVELKYGNESIYSITLDKIADGKYVSGYSATGTYIFVDENSEVTVPAGYTVEKYYGYTDEYLNGKATLVYFSEPVTETYTYSAIKIGDRFYDYNEFKDHSRWFYDEEEFRNHMYSTVRVYCIGNENDEIFAYYSKFIPGKYISFDENDRLYDFVLPEIGYEWNHIGYTEDGREVREYVYYVDESMGADIDVIQLSGGHVYYHINGQGYIKVNEHEYVRAILVDGEPVCILRQAYLTDEYINISGLIDQQLSFNGTDRLVITREFFDMMTDGCCIYIYYGNGNVMKLDYYELEAYFNGGVSGGEGKYPMGDYEK